MRGGPLQPAFLMPLLTLFRAFFFSTIKISRKLFSGLYEPLTSLQRYPGEPETYRMIDNVAYPKYLFKCIKL